MSNGSSRRGGGKSRGIAGISARTAGIMLGRSRAFTRQYKRTRGATTILGTAIRQYRTIQALGHFAGRVTRGTVRGAARGARRAAGARRR